MANITLNSAVRSNLRTLQATSDLLQQTEKRISTGKKVTSALDNPSSFFTSQALDRRSGDLNNLLDSVSNSVKTLEAADNGIRAISKVVESLKATARSALQSPSAVATKSNVESSAINGLTASNLVGGGSPTAATITGSVTGLTSSTTLASLGFGSSYSDSFNFQVPGSLSIGYGSGGGGTIGDVINTINNYPSVAQASLTGDGRFQITLTDPGKSFILSGSSTGFSNLGTPVGTYAPTTTNALSGKTLSFADSRGATKTVTFSAGAGANDVDTLDKLNGWLEANDVAVQASVSGSGATAKLKLESTNAAAYATPADLAGTSTGAGGAFASNATFSAPVLDPAAAARRAAFVKDYNDALKQISSLARDASFNGVNLLQGDDLDITFNEDGTSKLGVKGTNFDFGGLGLGSLADADFLDSHSIDTVLDRIGGVFSKLESQSSKFGSQLQIVQTRQSFTRDQVGTLEDGAAALTDADTNGEAAKLATLQTRQSLIVSSLSISTSSEQSILTLLR